MANDDKKIRQTDGTTALAELIKAIDRQADQVPQTLVAEGFEVLGSFSAREYKRGRQYVRFYLNNTAFALPLKNALEIDYLPEVTPLPNLPRWVEGICNLRGTIVSVVDLKQILRLEEGSHAVRKLILISNEDISTAIIVEKVAGMLFDDDAHKPIDKSAMTTAPFLHFVQEIIAYDGQPVYLLDVDVLMTALAISV
ncbi:MAG: hypothetical protein VR64_02620 [Desulfatitalea sp. BRH_c12]|nr:MAG: hypothetical protein VR64_02620 [Desulfatitalea sp. BRH_c12]